MPSGTRFASPEDAEISPLAQALFDTVLHRVPGTDFFSVTAAQGSNGPLTPHVVAICSSLRQPRAVCRRNATASRSGRD